MCTWLIQISSYVSALQLQQPFSPYPDLEDPWRQSDVFHSLYPPAVDHILWGGKKFSGVERARGILQNLFSQLNRRSRQVGSRDVAALFWNHLQSSICKEEKRKKDFCFTGLLFLYLGLLFLPFSSLQKHLLVAVSSLILFLLFIDHKNDWQQMPGCKNTTMVFIY